MTLTDAEREALAALAPTRGPRAPDEPTLHATLDALIKAEAWRRGVPDEVTGAYHLYALTQGALLRHEYDLSTHGHYESGWEIGAIVVDVQRMILINQDHGFPTGDAVLRAVATTLQQTYPTSKVVRIHSDAFAVLLPPSAEVVLDAGGEQTTRDALSRGVPAALEQAGHPAVAPDYTITLLQLTIVRPSHWQVLGPLVWAECERGHVLTRTGQGTGVQRRRIELEAAVPVP